MTRKRLALVLVCALLLAVAGWAQAAVITVTSVQKITGTGVEPAEWEYTNGWSVVTNKLGLGKIMVSGPSFCEAKYEPYTVYELDSASASSDFPRWEYVLDGGNPIPRFSMGRGSFYASCDRHYGYGINSPTPSCVWLGTDEHADQSLVGIKLSQIKTAKYCAFVSRNPSWLAPGIADSSWDSWTWWYNPRFPIQLQFTVEGPGGRKQIWYRPWGNHSTIGDQASDGRLGLWEEYTCIDEINLTAYGRWFSPGDISWNTTTQFEDWSEVLAAYGDYTLVATSTAYDTGDGQWKSVGYTDSADPPDPELGADLATDPPGNPGCTGTGKCLNFWVGARFYRLKRPDDGTYKTWYPESMGFRGQVDHFVLEIDRNEDGDVADSGESAVYDFEPPADDLGPKIVCISQRCLNDANTQDTLIEKRAEPGDIYDPLQNPDKDTKENRLYDVLFKVYGTVVAKANPYFAVDDGTGLSLPTRTYTLDDRNENWIPYNPAQVGQYWESWGLLERFRPIGKAPYVTKPFLVWTSKSHDRKLWP